MTKIALSVLAMVLISGCAIKMKSNVPAGAPDEYKIGFEDGCDSGYVSAGNPYYSYKKDVMRFQSDVLYKDGWTDGFNNCKSQYEHVGRMIR